MHHDACHRVSHGYSMQGSETSFQDIGPGLLILCSYFYLLPYYAFEQRSHRLPIMLNMLGLLAIFQVCQQILLSTQLYESLFTCTCTLCMQLLTALLECLMW